jgi:steroid 5-alpha reductase family enzyme
MDFFTYLVGAAALTAVAMVLIARDAAKRGKVDGVDIGWAGGILLSSWWGGIGAAFTGEVSLHGAVAVGLITFWGIRLIRHLYFDRLLRPEEDGRYRDLKAGWGANTARNMRYFFVAQGVLSVLFSFSIYAALSGGGSSSILALLAAALFFAALLGETTADRQLAAFRSKPENKGEVCNVGLWRYSRHPNYFFEWIIWISFVPLAGSMWWLALIPVALLWYLFMYVTGIPPTEAQSLRSRGDKYRRYQETTSPFFPLPPKKQ